jgi:putative acetyltransferase
MLACFFPGSAVGRPARLIKPKTAAASQSPFEDLLQQSGYDVGFVPASQKGLASEYPVPDEVFMVIELEPGALKGRHGLVKYRPEFARSLIS